MSNSASALGKLEDIATNSYNWIKGEVAPAAPVAPAPPKPPEGTIPVQDQSAIRTKYGLPANTDLTKPVLDPANKDVKNPVAFSQAYQEFNGPAPKKSLAQRVVDATGVTQPWEGSMAPRTAEELVAPAEYLGADIAGEIAAPYVKRVAGKVVGDLAENVHNWRLARNAEQAAEAEGHTITLKPGQFHFDDLGGTEVAPAPAETETPLETRREPETVLAPKAFTKNPPVESITQGANAYNEERGRPPVQPSSEPLNADLGKRTAEAYEKMPHNPESPEVRASYDAMKKDIADQWNYATQDMGIKFEPTTEDPYKNSQEMQADVRDNHHLAFYATENLPEGHPLAEIDPKTGLSYNQMFRAVHDLFGHAANGNTFSALGERNAYLDHTQMFSDAAVPAVTTETHGQNSWVNFGEHLRNDVGEIPKKGEPGYIAPKDRPFAQQKAGILPYELQGQPTEFSDLGGKTVMPATVAKSATAEPITYRTDSLGVRWASRPDSPAEVSVPQRLQGADADAYASEKLDLQKQFATASKISGVPQRMKDVPHELAHAIVARKYGISGVSGVMGKGHPLLPSGAAAAYQFDFSPWGAVDGRATLNTVKDHMDELTEMLMAGAEGDKLFGETDYIAHKGGASDRAMLSKIMHKLGYHPEEILSKMLAAAKNANRYLTDIGAKDIIAEHLANPEEGLPRGVLMSQDRVNQIGDEINARTKATQEGANAPRNGEEVLGSNRQNVARGNSGGAEALGRETTVKPVASKVGEPKEKGDTSFEFGANAPEEKSNLQKMTESFPPTSDPKSLLTGAGFITPDGKFMKLPAGTEHPAAINRATGVELPQGGVYGNAGDVRPEFLKDTSLVRTRMLRSKAGNDLHVSYAPGQLTPEAVQGIKQIVGANKYGNLILEQGQPAGKSITKEFATPADVDTALRTLGDHPDKTAAGWSADAAKTAAKEPAGAINPLTGKSNEEVLHPVTGELIKNPAGAEYLPEARQPLDHAPTQADFDAFYEKNKDVFTKRPGLAVGWDNNSKVPGGHELNVAAAGEGAVNMARKLDQREAWDIKKNSPIATGGDGLQTKFPNYPEKERWNDLHKLPQSNIPNFENTSKRAYDLMSDDLRTYLSDKPKLQKRVMAEFHKNPVPVSDGVASAQSGADLNGWWRRYIDIFNRIGDAGTTKVSKAGVPYSEILKQWHAALSGNKKVEQANNLAFHSFLDWLDAGEPTDRDSLDAIIRKNGAQPEGSGKKGNAALSDTRTRTGKIKNEGSDTSKLFSLVNSPEMRGEKPFSGKIWSEEHPIRGKGLEARKIPSMGASVAGTGHLENAVVDTHMFDFLGLDPGTEARYIANCLYLTQVGKELGLPTGEAQEQIWGVVIKFKSLLKEGLTPDEAAARVMLEGVYEEGKDYADTIAKDKEISGKGGVLDKLKTKYGIGPGSEGFEEIHAKTRAAEPARAPSGEKPVDKTGLANTAERIRGTIFESEIKKVAAAATPKQEPALKWELPKPKYLKAAKSPTLLKGAEKAGAKR